MPLTGNETEVLRHLGYEWWMARSTHNILLDMTPIADPVRNALIESMNIHIRGLVSFFCDKPRKDDWSVSHLNRNLKSVEIPDNINALMIDINKRVAHLTARRADFFHEWHVEQALEFIERKMLEVRTALAADFPSDWNGDAPETTIMLRSLNFKTVVGASAQPIGATGPAPPGY